MLFKGLMIALWKNIMGMFKKFLKIPEIVGVPVQDGDIEGSWNHCIPETHWVYSNIHPLKETQKHIGQVKKKKQKPTLKWVEEAEEQSCHKPHPSGMATHNWEKTHNSELFHEE